MQGKLHTALIDQDKCTCCNQSFSIQDVVAPRVMYALLPKEEVYVNIQEWEHEYLKSQVQELVHIFRCIGANELMIKTSQKDEDKKSVGGGLGVNLFGIDVEAEATIKKETVNYDSIQTHIVFDKHDKDVVAPTLDELLTDKNVYYLKHRPAWISFVNCRLKGCATEIEFAFTHHDMIHMKRSFVTRLQRLGVSIKYNNKEITWVKMDFYASFI